MKVIALASLTEKGDGHPSALHVGPGSASFTKLKKTELLFNGLNKNKYIVLKAIPETKQVSGNVSDSTLSPSLSGPHSGV